MRVVVERNEPMRSVRVFVLRDSTDGGWAALLGEQGVRWERVPDGAQPRALLALPEDLFAAIVSEGMSLVPESAVMERAWVDAIIVRDRLLAIVERIEP